MALAGAFLAGALGIVESWWVRLEEITVGRADLPREADGFSILQISDLHSRVGLARNREVVGILAGLSADVAVITGDFRAAGGDTPTSVTGGSLVAEAVRRRMPVYAVAGNNDTPEVLSRLVRGGMRVLENETVRLERGLWLAGWDPYTRRSRSLGEVLDSVPAGDFVVLLAHSPEVVLEPRAGRAGLILTGHTHGGQVRLPGFGSMIPLTRLGPRYHRGLHDWGGSTLYINRGIGTTMVPLRLYSAPEVARLTLRRAGTRSS